MIVSLKKIAIGALTAVAMTACSAAPQTSKTLVTDVEHSEVKRQSIGNCWIYATGTWLESEILTHEGVEVNVSESYWTWWHWYGQLVNSNLSEVNTGGFWATSANIILRHGYVLEGEFIPAEANAEMSHAQAAALETVNAALKPGGALAAVEARTAANVRSVLDQAWGTNMAQTEALARNPQTEMTSVDSNGQAISLAQALSGNANQRWSSVSFPRVYGQNTVVGAQVRAARSTLLKRVLRALNDHKPVVMSLMIDFNALDTTDATFKKALQDTNGVGRQGGHMLALEDYSVNDAPGYGHIGFGDVPDAEKAAAVDGQIEMLRAKNSWGKNRPDRGLIDGYTNFDWAYLTGQMEWRVTEESDQTTFYTTLTDFTLPPGY